MIEPDELFLLLSDKTRLRCLVLLHLEKELCVCEISHTLESIQPKISRHLSILRKSRLVQDERRGKWVYYKINADLDKKTKALLTTILNSLKGSEPFSLDYEKLLEFRKSDSCGT